MEKIIILIISVNIEITIIQTIIFEKIWFSVIIWRDFGRFSMLNIVSFFCEAGVQRDNRPEWATDAGHLRAL